MAASLRLWGFCIVSAFLASVSTTAHSAEVSAADCTNLVLNLADCLSFVVEGSTATYPKGDCCSGLKIVVTTNAECLCEAFKNSAQLGVKLNVTKAMTLPVVCRVSSSSVANCSSTGGSGEAPAPSPFSEPPSSGAETPSPTTIIGVNEVVSPPAPGKSGSSSLVSSVSVWIFVLSTTVAAAVALFA
ncbi:non-specific lipid transfer protein GPI-anchored 11-like [Primulina tabacum]|uniref:non-specific lipid transfer protein GPI-anchored 11-like n=1 Tax=Primulina tabacum TaxID=48773 RepID=UPI003F591237